MLYWIIVKYKLKILLWYVIIKDVFEEVKLDFVFCCKLVFIYFDSVFFIGFKVVCGLMICEIIYF